MASIIKKEKDVQGRHVRGIEECKFVDELLNSEADSKTTILDADSQTTVLEAEKLKKAVEPEPEPEVQEQPSHEEPPGTTVLNFADVTSKELKVEEKPEVKEKKAEPQKSVLKKAKNVVSKKKSEEPTVEATPSIMWEPEEVKPKSAGFQIKLKKTGEAFDLEKEKTSVGKSKFSDIQIKDTQTVSRTHVILHLDGDKLFLEDNKSLNGTFVNNQRLLSGERREVFDGDVIRMSDEELVVCSKEGGR